MNRGEQRPNPTNGGEVEFLRAELDTGFTLARIALHATHEDKTNRNRRNARKAYDSLLHFIPRATLAPEEADEIKSKLETLRSKLLELGEEI
jgi:hypothetical protein